MFFYSFHSRQKYSWKIRNSDIYNTFFLQDFICLLNTYKHKNRFRLLFVLQKMETSSKERIWCRKMPTIGFYTETSCEFGRPLSFYKSGDFFPDFIILCLLFCILTSNSTIRDQDEFIRCCLVSRLHIIDFWVYRNGLSSIKNLKNKNKILHYAYKWMNYNAAESFLLWVTVIRRYIRWGGE